MSQILLKNQFELGVCFAEDEDEGQRQQSIGNQH